MDYYGLFGCGLKKKYTRSIAKKKKHCKEGSHWVLNETGAEPKLVYTKNFFCELLSC